jgi:hypothetical protein
MLIYLWFKLKLPNFIMMLTKKTFMHQIKIFKSIRNRSQDAWSFYRLAVSSTPFSPTSVLTNFKFKTFTLYMLLTQTLKSRFITQCLKKLFFMINPPPIKNYGKMFTTSFVNTIYINWQLATTNNFLHRNVRFNFKNLFPSVPTKCQLLPK